MPNIRRFVPPSLLALILALAPAAAQVPSEPTSVADLFFPADPALDVINKCSGDAGDLGDDGIPLTGDPNESFSWPLCITGYGGSGILQSTTTGPVDSIGSMHVRREFVPEDDGTCPGRGTWRLDRITPDGTVSPIGEFRTRCEEGFLRDLLILDAGLDQVEGTAYVSLLAFNHSSEGTSHGVGFTVKMEGLPTLFEILTTGPPGPPQLPFPRCKQPAESALIALEQQIAALQAQLAVLSSRLEQVEARAAPQ
ncbi:MAG: hypothetical protein ACREAA_01750 [Candidatus Polarisedimenticolia bacterium]